MFKAHVKLYVLKGLSSKSMSGYDLMKFLEGFLGKKPSAGYMYPLLHGLKKSKFVGVRLQERKKVYSITSEGKKFLLNLESRHKQMINRCMSDFKALTTQRELVEFKGFHKRMHDYKDEFVKDMDLWKQLYQECFRIYGNKGLKNRRKELRTVLSHTIGELEGLSREKRA